MNTDITKEINNYDRIQNELEERKTRQETDILDPEICKTPNNILNDYFNLNKNIEMASNKQKKKIMRELEILELNNKSLKKDISLFNELEKTKLELEKNNGFKLNAINYIQNNIDLIVSILTNNSFITSNLTLTDKAVVAMQLQEVHCLALSDLYQQYNSFIDISDKQLACIFSMFTNISIPDDQRSSIPYSNDQLLNQIGIKLTDNINKYYDLECEYQLDTGTDYTLHYELIDYINEWCDAVDEIKCKNLIIKIKEEKEIFLGEFIKAILKINNIASEFEKICESVQNISLLQKIKNIPVLTLKYVATNQSLYI